MKIHDLFQMACKYAKTKKTQHDHRAFLLGSVGIRNDGAVVHSSNGSDYNQNRKIHSEFRLSRKLDLGSVVVVVRLLRNGEFALSLPCPSCMACLVHSGVKKVLYSISSEEYGCIVIDRKRGIYSESVYRF